MGRSQSGGATDSVSSVKSMNRVILSASRQIVHEPMAVVVVCAGTEVSFSTEAGLSSGWTADFQAEKFLLWTVLGRGSGRD